MFNVVVHRRKGRAWSARTVAVSVGAHLLVLTGVVVAAANSPATPPPDDDRDSIRWIDPQEKRSNPPAPARPATPPSAQLKPVPTPRRTPELQAPDSVPTRIEPPRPGETPQPPDSGVGPSGGVSGTPGPTPQPPAGSSGPQPDFRTPDPHIPSEVDQLPQLLNPREAQRMLERVYPSMLRDAGVTGHTTVVLVVDRNGRVEPGSVTVQETTHDAFREAAVRAAERFRFRPAKLHGQPVSVIISLPIEWTIAR
jgi:protein TonB